MLTGTDETAPVPTPAGKYTWNTTVINAPPLTTAALFITGVDEGVRFMC